MDMCTRSRYPPLEVLIVEFRMEANGKEISWDKAIVRSYEIHTDGGKAGFPSSCLGPFLDRHGRLTSCGLLPGRVSLQCRPNHGGEVGDRGDTGV